MQERLRRIGTPGSKVIGVDEIAICKGHTYRIVVSDLLRRRPIWFGGQERAEQSMEVWTIRFGRSRDEVMVYAMNNTCASRFSLACLT